MEEAELKVKPHPAYDDVRRWPELFRPPADVDVAAFQQRIDAITGTADGQPLIKLSWAWESREWIDEAWRAKYRFLTVAINGEEVDICPPRWVFEERYEPGQYWDSWQATRYHREDITEVVSPDGVVSYEGGRLIDRKGEPPRDGWYNYLVGCQPVEHSSVCCEKMWNQGRKACWGYYRPPAQSDLDHISRIVARKNADDFKQSPHEPLTTDSLSDAQRSAFAKSEKLEESNRTGTLERFAHYDRSYGHILRGGGSKYLLPYTPPLTGFKETASGLVVPENN